MTLEERIRELRYLLTLSKPPVYRHFKGNFYKVISIAKSSNDPTDKFVVYISIHDDEIWIRPLEEFMSESPTTTYTQYYRFELVEEEI